MKAKLTLNTSGSQDKQFKPMVAGAWSVQEWRQGTHRSTLTANETYSAEDSITVGFDADGWTESTGSITQTTKADGELTTKTDAEGKKEFKRYVSFAPPDEDYGTSSGGGSGGSGSTMVGSGYEIVGMKSIREEDTTDKFNGTAVTVTGAIVNPDRELIWDDDLSGSNSVEGTRTGTDKYYEKHSYELTNNGTATTYGGGYVLKSTTSRDANYPSTATNDLWFGRSADGGFGQIGYRGILGEYSMAVPTDPVQPSPHQTIDPSALAFLQDPAGTGTQTQDDGSTATTPAPSAPHIDVRSVSQVPIEATQLTASEIEKLLEAGIAIREGNTVAVPFVNAAGVLRWLVYDYHDAYRTSAVYNLGGPVFYTDHPSTATFKFNLSGGSTGAMFQDPAAEAAAMHFQANMMIVGGVVTIALVPIAAAEAIAIAAAAGFSGTTGVLIFGAGEIASQYYGVPIPLNPASLLSLKRLGKILTIAPKLTDDLLAAAKRLGVKVDEFRVVNGIANATIDFTSSFSRADLDALLAFARQSGAKQVILNTGQVVKPSIARSIQQAIDARKPYLGGTPSLVREVGPSLIPGDPIIRIFQIIFDL